MGRAQSEPPAGADEPPAKAPAWFDEVVSPSATVVQPGTPGATRHEPGAPGGIADFMRVGSESPGRYVYLSPDGERGAELGRGGIGRVLVAMDEHLGREVAIKELLTGHDAAEGDPDPELLTRFLAEARITGQLEHPNIVPVYELGRRLDGRLYYTMRVVRGETLSAALERAVDLEGRLALLSHFARLCHAIAYAHSRGVVHRDIKPDNVMIGEFGETIVLDWGIAKVKGQAAASAARAPRGVGFVGETSHGDLVGTPLFMSPEQALGEVDQIDEASDVWSLGVVLYLLLTGKPPFPGKTTEEVVRKVTEGRPAPVRRLTPLAPSELCAVAMRALSRDKSERYASVRELARDVEAFMSGGRVRAYDYSALELFRRFYQRHRAAAIVGIVALVSLLVVATALQRRILSARDRALLAERTALDRERVARQSLAEVFTERALNATLEGDVLAAELYAARALMSGERADARGSVVAQTNRREVLPLESFPEFQGCPLLAGSGRGALACARGRELLFWTPGAVVTRFEAPDAPARLALSADAGTLLVAFEDGRFLVYDPATRAPRSQFRAEPGVPAALALSDDGERFLTTAETGWAQLWETASARPVARVRLSEPITARAFSPTGQRIALGGRLGALALWEPETEQLSLLEGHRGTVTAVAFSRRGDVLGSGGSDRTLSLWNAVTGKRLAPPLRDVGTVLSLGWAADEATLVFGSDDRMLGLLDARHPQYAERLRGHPGPVSLAAFAGDAQLVSVSAQLGLQVSSYRAPLLPRELAHKSNVLALAFVSSELLAAAGLPQEGVCLWQITEERCKTRLPVSEGQIRALAVHAPTRRLALATSLGRLGVWNLDTALPELVLDTATGQLRSLEFTRDGQALLSSSSEGVVVLWDVASGQAVRRFAETAPVQDAALDAERSRVLIATRTGAVEVWDLAGKKLRSVQAHREWTMDLALHGPTGRLATLGGEGKLALWSLDGLTQLDVLPAHEGRALSADFSPNGELLASAGEDGVVQLWSVERREPLARLVHHRGAARSVRFSPDGKLLASGGDDGSVRLWDLSRLSRSPDVLLSDIERAGIRLNGVKLELGAGMPRGNAPRATP